MSKDQYRQREAMRYKQPIASREAILTWLEKQRSPARVSAIFKAMKFKDEGLKVALERRLQAMERDGQLMNKRQGWCVAPGLRLVEGTVVLSHKGTAEVKGASERIVLPPRQARGIADGDRVKVRVGKHTYKGGLLAVLVEVMTCEDQAIMAVYHEHEGQAWAESFQDRQRWPMPVQANMADGCV